MLRYARPPYCRVKKLSFVGLVFLSIVAVRGDGLGDEVMALKVNLGKDRQLSSNELRQIVRIAHGIGIQRVASIGLVTGQTGDHGVFITTEEKREGRRVSRREMTLWHEQWRANNQRPHAFATTNIAGPFLQDRAPVRTRHWAMFTLHGKEVRLECPLDTDLRIADKVFF